MPRIYVDEDDEIHHYPVCYDTSHLLFLWHTSLRLLSMDVCECVRLCPFEYILCLLMLMPCSQPPLFLGCVRALWWCVLKRSADEFTLETMGNKYALLTVIALQFIYISSYFRFVCLLLLLLFFSFFVLFAFLLFCKDFCVTLDGSL